MGQNEKAPLVVAGERIAPPTRLVRIDKSPEKRRCRRARMIPTEWAESDRFLDPEPTLSQVAEQGRRGPRTIVFAPRGCFGGLQNALSDERLFAQRFHHVGFAVRRDVERSIPCDRHRRVCDRPTRACCDGRCSCRDATGGRLRGRRPAQGQSECERKPAERHCQSRRAAAERDLHLER